MHTRGIRLELPNDASTKSEKKEPRNDKTFYHLPDTNLPFGFVLLFFDARGFADLIDRALLVAHELSMTLELFSEPSYSVVVFFYLSV
jgi:hypothetical protein